MPDKYLAQDKENQFKSMFFRGGCYQREAIVIPKIISVSGLHGKIEMIFYFKLRIIIKI
jgi:hypothetical protein